MFPLPSWTPQASEQMMKFVQQWWGVIQWFTSRSTSVSPSAFAEELREVKHCDCTRRSQQRWRYQRCLSHHLSLVLRSPQLRLPNGYEKMRAFSKVRTDLPTRFGESPQTAAWDFSNTSLQKEMLGLTACPWVILPHHRG